MKPVLPAATKIMKLLKTRVEIDHPAVIRAGVEAAVAVDVIREADLIVPRPADHRGTKQKHT